MVTMELDRRNEQPSQPFSAVIDELQYSRLIFTLGKQAVEALHQSRVLIVGCRGLGAEIAKDLLLSGVGAIGLVDDELVSIHDLGSNFCLSEADVGFNRAVSIAQRLRELNPSADVDFITEPSFEASLSNYDLVIGTSGSLPDLVHLNNSCRLLGLPFIAAQVRGLFCFVFSDLGDSYRFKDDCGESLGTLLVANVTQDSPATVTFVEEQRHGLEDGDEVVFSGIKGMYELNQLGSFKVTVTGTHTISIPLDTRAFGRYTSGGYLQKMTSMKSLQYSTLETALQSPVFQLSENFEYSREPHIHVALQAIDECARLSGQSFGETEINTVVARAKDIWVHTAFQGRGVNLKDSQALKGRSPIQGEANPAPKKNETSQSDGINGGGSAGDMEEVQPTTTCSPCLRPPNSVDEQLVRLLAQTANVELCPLVAVCGGLAAQEVIKVLGKVFIPLHQWFYYDAVDCAPVHLVNALERSPLQSRYDLQVALFGREFQQKLGNLQWLVVGAGGIGCEVLKNLVLMGVGCSPNGSITVTDMDRIWKPNYTDQLLYCMDDLGKQKTPTAARALRKINPEAQIHALQEKFDPEAEVIFDSSFFQSLSGVFSAVDTASSRLYIDMRCVTFRRPMIDGGKHGAKGSVQVFVPFQSEMYASTRDPPEFKESPICTLRNFPYSVDHTLRWAVETFESLFKQRPEDVNAYLSSRDFQESLKRANPSARLPVLETLYDALSRHKPLSFAACIHWARLQFEDLFSNNIKQLVYNFPEDMITTTGAPFWSGTKRIPSPITFNAMESLHYDFIVAAANLQATVYGLKGCQDKHYFLDALQGMNIPAFQPKEGIKIAVSDAEIRSSGQQKGFLGSEDNSAADKCEAIMQDLPTSASLAGYRLSSIDFEKDDERNFHVEFVTAASNLRAQNYGIPMSDKLQARLVGGRAVPSIVTATATVGGLMCLELYKVLLEQPLHCHKHSFFNLALPSFSAAEPIKAVINRVERSDHPPLLWNLWDKFEMNCVGMSLETFLRQFKHQHGLEITMLSYGKSLLYAEFVTKKKLQERMPMTLVDLISAVGKVTIPTSENRVVLSISCSDASDNDVDVPDVVAQVR